MLWSTQAFKKALTSWMFRETRLFVDQIKKCSEVPETIPKSFVYEQQLHTNLFPYLTHQLLLVGDQEFKLACAIMQSIKKQTLCKVKKKVSIYTHLLIIYDKHTMRFLKSAWGHNFFFKSYNVFFYKGYNNLPNKWLYFTCKY